MNRKFAAKHYVWLILFCLIGLLPGQRRDYSLNWNKDNLTHFWEGNLNYFTPPDKINRFYVKNTFRSTLYRESALGDKWRNDNLFHIGWKRSFSSKWSWQNSLQAQNYSDQNTRLKFNKYLLKEMLAYQPVRKVEIQPAVGYAWEDIHGYRDQGWYTQLNTRMDRFDLGGYLTSAEANSEIFFFPGRRNQEHRYYTAFNKKFSNEASDSIRVGYEFVENAYPLLGTHEIEQVEINSRFLYNQLSYRFSGTQLLEVQTRLQTRDITQSSLALQNHRKELAFLNRVQYRLEHPEYRFNFSLINAQNTNLASRRSGGGPEIRTDVEGLQAAFNLGGMWQFSSKDQLFLNFSYTKYEYTSPDTSQRVDEDDVRFIGDLTYRHKFSEAFLWELKAQVYLYHQIYIHAERSANNNWNRIFQLAPAVKWNMPLGIQLVSRSRVLANYTVYDFEDLLPEVKSYIHRKFAHSDSLSMPLTDALKCNLFYQLELEDNGTFFQDLFAQQVNRELRSHFFDAALVWSRFRGLQFTSGLNWYIRKEWRLIPEKEQSRNYFAFSPRLAVLWQVSRDLLFHLALSSRSYRDINISRKNYFTGQIRLKYLF